MSDVNKHAQLYESLSALVDDEASELEVHRLLAESEKDPALRTRWYRYQLARAALRGETVSTFAVDLSDQVRAAISRLDFETAVNDGANNTQGDAQPIVDTTPQRATTVPRWVAHGGRFAIAASVAAVVLVGAQQFNWLGGDGVANPAAIAADLQAPPATMPVAPSNLNNQPINVQTVSSGDLLTPVSRNSSVPRPGTDLTPEQQQWQDEQVRLYFQELIREHAESAAENNGTSLLPFVRVPVEGE